jgi:dCMP deaminase
MAIELDDSCIFSERWVRYFFTVAAACARMSKDPSTKCGAVIVRPNMTIASTGWNGFPRGVVDAPELYADRDQKYPRVLHAEMNAILSAREPLDGYTLFVGPMPPCARCGGAIIQSGIRRVIYTADTDTYLTRWCDEIAMTQDMFRQVGVTLIRTALSPRNLGWYD